MFIFNVKNCEYEEPFLYFLKSWWKINKVLYHCRVSLSHLINTDRWLCARLNCMSIRSELPLFWMLRDLVLERASYSTQVVQTVYRVRTSGSKWAKREILSIDNWPLVIHDCEIQTKLEWLPTQSILNCAISCLWKIHVAL